MRRVTVNLRTTIAAVVGVLSLPVLMGLGAKWSTLAGHQLRTTNTLLQVENGSYRAATGELTGQIQSLEERHQRPRRARHARSRAGARDAEAARPS